jgi:hypothetical protein
MNAIVIHYVLYLVLALSMTFWVARTLKKGGRLFLVDCFQGNTELADSVNGLLVVGFYLVNMGFISLYLKAKDLVETTQAVIESLSGKMGVVLLALGAMHFFNLYVLSRMRRRGLARNLPPPMPATGRVAVG